SIQPISWPNMRVVIMAFSDPELSDLAAQARENALHVCAHLFPNGYVAGRSFCVGNVYGDVGDSLKVNLVKGRFRDYADDTCHGDILNLVHLSSGADDWGRTKETLRRILRLPVPETFRNTNAAGPSKSTAELQAMALRIWRGTRNLRNTLGARYLLRRGIGRHLSNLAFDASCWWGWWQKTRPGEKGIQHTGRGPALIARFQDIHGRFAGIHRIYLSQDAGKADMPDPKMSLGDLYGAACRLQGRDVTVLFTTEAVEDGAAVATTLPELAVWAASSAGHLGEMDIPVSTRILLVGADNDKAGDAAFERLVERLQDRDGLIIIRARPVLKDWNEDLLKLGPLAVAARVRSFHQGLMQERVAA
ncbi:toprim domain-containing protein, partial [Asticcacaulis sp.]|uniref:DUF7146 domain-containing protein n=1 Tax=Asticcacaulis sp. TaxID=1872648 RepID=UPI002605EAB1